MLTQRRLKSQLRYSKKTGEFFWLVQKVWTNPVGSVAGCKNKAGYIFIGIDGERYFAQRLAFLYVTGRFPKEWVDHKNQVKSDNRWKNLREATATENKGNMGLLKSNSSGFRGVHHAKSRGFFMASISKWNRSNYIGVYGDARSAALAYDIEARKYFGKFAKTNASMGLL